MRSKFTAAALLAVSICVIAGCSTETQSAGDSSVNIIDIGSVS